MPPPHSCATQRSWRLSYALSRRSARKPKSYGRCTARSQPRNAGMKPVSTPPRSLSCPSATTKPSTVSKNKRPSRPQRSVPPSTSRPKTSRKTRTAAQPMLGIRRRSRASRSRAFLSSLRTPHSPSSSPTRAASGTATCSRPSMRTITRRKDAHTSRASSARTTPRTEPWTASSYDSRVSTVEHPSWSRKYSRTETRGLEGELMPPPSLRWHTSKPIPVERNRVF